MVERFDAPGLSEPPGYHHVAVASGSRVVFTAGQVPLDADGRLVGRDDPVAQTEQVLRNLRASLEAAGATPDQVVRTTVFVVARSPDDLGMVWRAFRGSTTCPVSGAPSTLLGVERLGYEGQLVEIEAIAVLP